MWGSNHVWQKCSSCTHDSTSVSRLSFYRHGVDTGCLGHFIHCTHALITSSAKCPGLPQTKHLRAFAFAFAFASGLLFAFVAFTFALVLAFYFGLLTFALVDCADVHVNWATIIPSFFRAHVTLDSQDHFLAVGANFFGMQPKMLLQLWRRLFHQRCSLHVVVELLARDPLVFTYHLLPL